MTKIENYLIGFYVDDKLEWVRIYHSKRMFEASWSYYIGFFPDSVLKSKNQKIIGYIETNNNLKVERFKDTE